jgi:TRAP-type C4-dicarboxylate transport system permease small subunit
MKKVAIYTSFAFVFFFLAFPAYAASADVTKIQSFIQSVIQVLVTLAGLVSAGFFVWGGIGYITSSGNPEALDRSKKTILYSAIGLAVVLGAFVLSNVVTQLATSSFGTGSGL